MTESAELEHFFKDYPFYTEEERELIDRAWQMTNGLTAGKTCFTAGPYRDHALRTAAILASLQMDSDTIIAALLHTAFAADIFSAQTPGPAKAVSEADAEIHTPGLKEQEEYFGPVVARIVTGCERIASVRIQNKTLQYAESTRKMFFAMIKDIRVILVKLAGRLDSLQNPQNIGPENLKKLAQESIDIWAPLAGRLGISSIKDEMEDLSLKYSSPDVYRQIKDIVALKRGEREAYLEKAQKEIYKAAVKENLNITITFRAKHFWSIYQKMKKRQKAADELYDLLALRILCDTPMDCYNLIGIVHNLWKPLEGRFKDYITRPKPNGYQSLHTTVTCEGKPLEIQIRTHRMHYVAEHGIASHWLYKQGTNRDMVSGDNLDFINRIKTFAHGGAADNDDFLENIKTELLSNSVLVFTPKGDVIELPAEATAIDFAYYIHSAVGEKIAGAKADGQIIPLSTPLKHTQVIEVLTNAQAHPTINQLQFVKTAKARSKIRAWLLLNDDSLIFDKDIVARRQQQTVLQEQQRGTRTGHGLPPRPTQNGGIAAANNAAQNGGDAEGAARNGTAAAGSVTEKPVKIRVGDTDNFLIHLAGCCNPVPADPIIGYVSRGRGIIVHRENCPNLKAIPEIEARLIDVAWEKTPEKNQACIMVTGTCREDIFSVVSEHIRPMRALILEGKLGETENHICEGTFLIQIRQKEDLKKILKALRRDPSIKKAHILS